MKIRLGIVGTNWISKAFLESALATGRYELAAVYSRRVETGRDFCQAFADVAVESDLAAFAALPDLDLVYIASPNGAHFQQAKVLVQAGKSLIVEKPAFSNLAEFEEIAALAAEKGVLIFEGARHIHEPNFKLLKDQLQNIGTILGANLSYMQYSSRYDAVLAGEEPNIFSLAYSGGALMDLGVYGVYAAISLFGYPESSRYFCQKIQTGVDGIGTMVLRYAGFDVIIHTGKIAGSKNPSEIYGSEGTLVAGTLTVIEEIYLDGRQGRSANLAAKGSASTMVDEAEVFGRIFADPGKYQEEYLGLLELSRQVHQLMTELRKDGDIVFAAD